MLDGGRIVSSVQIRSASPADYDLLLPLFLELRRFSRRNHPAQNDDFDAVLSASREYLHDILARDVNATVLVAESESGTVAAYLVATIQEPNPLTSSGAVKTGSIDELYVDESFRGRGVAGSLLSAADDWFRRCDVERVEVGAYAWNTDAIAFYERQGFSTWTVTLSRPLGP